MKSMFRETKVAACGRFLNLEKSLGVKGVKIEVYGTYGKTDEGT